MMSASMYSATWVGSGLMTMHAKNVREDMDVKILVRIRETFDGKTQRKGTAKYEASRNLGQELLAAAREVKAGRAARSLLAIAQRRPEVLRELFA